MANHVESCRNSRSCWDFLAFAPRLTDFNKHHWKWRLTKFTAQLASQLGQWSFHFTTSRYTVSWLLRHAASGIQIIYWLHIITETKHFRWWNVSDDTCRMGRWSFWSRSDVNRPRLSTLVVSSWNTWPTCLSKMTYTYIFLSASFSRSPCWPTVQWTAVHPSTCHLTSSGSPTCHPDCCGFDHLIPSGSVSRLAASFGVLTLT